MSQLLNPTPLQTLRAEKEQLKALAQKQEEQLKITFGEVEQTIVPLLFRSATQMLMPGSRQAEANRTGLLGKASFITELIPKGLATFAVQSIARSYIEKKFGNKQSPAKKSGFFSSLIVKSLPTILPAVVGSWKYVSPLLQTYLQSRTKKK